MMYYRSIIDQISHGKEMSHIVGAVWGGGRDSITGGAHDIALQVEDLIAVQIALS